MSQFIVQNALLIIIAVIAAVSLAMPLINTRRFGPMVSSEQAVSLINKQNALVVDVRAQKDFKRVRIANSVNIPANESGRALKGPYDYCRRQLGEYVCSSIKASARRGLY